MKLSTCVGTYAIGKLMQKKLSRVGVGGWVGVVGSDGNKASSAPVELKLGHGLGLSLAI